MKSKEADPTKVWYAHCNRSTWPEQDYLIWMENDTTYGLGEDGELFNSTRGTSGTPGCMEINAWDEAWEFTEPYSIVPAYVVLRCAECDEPSYTDYLCPECRE